MATTTNYGWTTPNDTDLVKDGASAIRTLGTAIDTTVFNNASAAIAKTIVDAKGDIIAATAADTVSRLAVGANGTILTADSTAATGIKWGAAPSANDSWTLLNAGGTALTGASTVTVSGISGKEKLFILVSGASSSAQSTISLRFNTDTGNNYYSYGTVIGAPTTYISDQIGAENAGTINQLVIAQMSTSTSSTVSGYCLITGCASSTNIKFFQTAGGCSNSGSSGHQDHIKGGYYNSTSAITSVSVTCPGGGNLDAGTVFVYANS